MNLRVYRRLRGGAVLGVAMIEERSLAVPETDAPADLNAVVEALCRPESYAPLLHESAYHVPMPSLDALAELMACLRAALFPGYFGHTDIHPENMPFYMGTLLDRAQSILAEQVKRGLCFTCVGLTRRQCVACERRSAEVAAALLGALPELRRLLASDVAAAFDGDPAALSTGEVICCYPSIHAVTNYRVAHTLHRLGVPLIPRILTERAHSDTGIDIHPGAEIGERFFIDHGTGVVIGETCVIGRGVRLYQGVTLGAKSFPLDADGKPIKGVPRHPIVEDDVIIYSGATVLGRITIGRGSVIGGNVWLTHSVPPRSRVQQGRLQESSYENGGGI